MRRAQRSPPDPLLLAPVTKQRKSLVFFKFIVKLPIHYYFVRVKMLGILENPYSAKNLNVYHNFFFIYLQKQKLMNISLIADTLYFPLIDLGF